MNEAAKKRWLVQRGACAGWFAAMVKNKLCKQNDKIAVNLLGGKLTISFEEG